MNKEIITQIEAINGVASIHPLEHGLLIVKTVKPDPKSLTVDELVDGEIYSTVDKGCDILTLRFKSHNSNCVTDVRVNCYSYRWLEQYPTTEMTINDWCCIIGKRRIVRHATEEEKKIHIKKEVERGYFHELRSK